MAYRQPAFGRNYFAAEGTGTLDDPYIPEVNLTIDTVELTEVEITAIAAGDNNIGNVDVVTLPALPAGTNNIGDVDIASIAAGDNNIGNVDVASIAAGTNNIGDVDIASIAAGDNNIGNVDIATIAAGETHIGQVGVSGTIVPITFSLDTNAYADGDVLADSQILANALRINDGTGEIVSLVLNDKDDQGVAMDVVFLSANVSLGTENGAVAITDADADNILGVVHIDGADWIDMINSRVATKRDLGLKIKAVTGAASIYVGLITRGAPTHTASGITGRIGINRD
jgi:hypothetical protein